MKWRGRERSTNIQDRRGAGGGGIFGRGLGGLGGTGSPRMRIPMPAGRGGASIGGLIAIVVIFLVISWIAGVNPLSLLTGQSPTQTQTSTSAQPLPEAGEDELLDFVAVVLRDTELLWTEIFQQNELTYDPPTLVLYSGQDSSACGLASASTGPFYCPADQDIYLDLGFYEQLRREFGAPGDFAQAYVLAHEVGHHVQNMTGEMDRFAEFRQTNSEADINAYSVRVELQADCYAGLWAAYAGQENLLESGDIEEALNAAEAIGDDTIQRRQTGYTVPRTYTHGTSAQRQRWFNTGYTTGDVGACNTFSGNI